MESQSQPKDRESVPKIVTGLIVAVVLLAVVFMTSYQVRYDEYAVVLRFGAKPMDRDTSPGVHAKWPWPFEKIWRHDSRIRNFDGSQGEFEELKTKDGKGIVVDVYISWRVAKDSHIVFMENVGTTEKAEERLTAFLRDAKLSVFSEYNFSDLINVDPKRVKLADVEKGIMDRIHDRILEEFGIEVTSTRLRQLGLPSTVTQAVFDRMSAERLEISKKKEGEGRTQADKILSEAQVRSLAIVAEADSEASTIRAEGDAIAAKAYKNFDDNPKLAEFLLSMESIKEMTNESKMVLFLDLSTPPWSWLGDDKIRELIEASKKTATGDGNGKREE